MLVPKLVLEGSNDRIVIGIDPNDLAPFPPYLPLELFDNTEYESRNPDEWLALGEDNGIRRPIPGKALLPSQNDHKYCKEIFILICLYLN